MNETIRRSHIELVKGKVRWFFRLVASNGQVITTSQKYFSRGNAKRAALRNCDRLGLELREL